MYNRSAFRHGIIFRFVTKMPLNGDQSSIKVSLHREKSEWLLGPFDLPIAHHATILLIYGMSVIAEYIRRAQSRMYLQIEYFRSNSMGTSGILMVKK